MKLLVEKLHRKSLGKGGRYPKQLGERHTFGRRHIRSVYDETRNVVRVYHATKGWRERNADRLIVTH